MLPVNSTLFAAVGDDMQSFGIVSGQTGIVTSAEVVPSPSTATAPLDNPPYIGGSEPDDSIAGKSDPAIGDGSCAAGSNGLFQDAAAGHLPTNAVADPLANVALAPDNQADLFAFVPADQSNNGGVFDRTAGIATDTLIFANDLTDLAKVLTAQADEQGLVILAELTGEGIADFRMILGTDNAPTVVDCVL